MIKFIIIHVHETFAFKAIFLLFCLYMHSEFSTILCIDIAIKMKSFFYFTHVSTLKCILSIVCLYHTLFNDE